MDYIDDDAVRPRFQFHSSATSSSPQSSSSALHRRPINKLHFSLCSLTSLLLLFFTFLSAKIPYPFFDNPVFRLLLLWTALSLLIAPFAPLSVTGGEISVGKGDPLPDDNDDADAEDNNHSLKDNDNSRKRSSLRQRRINSTPPPPPPEVVSIAPQPKIGKGLEKEEDCRKMENEGSSEKEWTLEDFELLKKTVAKNPPGIRGRWENVAEAFKGKIKRERVIAAAKVVGTVKPGNGESSFTAFLRQVRKEGEGDDRNGNGEGEKEHWSAAEDLALLNALKVFTKETAMRWEKVAEAVPGKSKGSCIKRFGELKKDFRSSKESS